MIASSISLTASLDDILELKEKEKHDLKIWSHL